MIKQNQESNWVLLVPLSGELAYESTLTWIDIVTKKRKYFHPYGNRWPLDPPNYLGFHYYGKLQSVHHVESCKIVTEFHEHIPEIPVGVPGEQSPAMLYWLGPRFKPSHDVLKKGIWPSGHKWAMLDTLFTYDTIAEATRISMKRQKESA